MFGRSQGTIKMKQANEDKQQQISKNIFYVLAHLPAKLLVNACADFQLIQFLHFWHRKCTHKMPRETLVLD